MPMVAREVVTSRAQSGVCSLLRMNLNAHASNLWGPSDFGMPLETHGRFG